MHSPVFVCESSTTVSNYVPFCHCTERCTICLVLPDVVILDYYSRKTKLPFLSIVKKNLLLKKLQNPCQIDIFSLCATLTFQVMHKTMHRLHNSPLLYLVLLNSFYAAFIELTLNRFIASFFLFSFGLI